MQKRHMLVFLAAFSAAAFSTLPAGTASAQSVFDVRSGAVGSEGRQEMMQVYDNYNLHLAFAEQFGGAFVADVDVTIRDDQGQVAWQGATQGPYLFANLPDGRYKVEASFEGKKKARNIVVGHAGGAMQYMYW